ncbi:MAG TPA: spore coat U domain-containing protein [Gemmatimonadaceae bacterium]
MRRYALVAVAAAVGFCAGLPLYADSTTAVIQISASVRKNCLISTTAVAYGAYDPVAANATAPLDATGAVVITCTKGTNASIGLDGGANAQGPTRRMTDGATAYLTYDLFQDNAHSVVWTNTGSGMMTIPAAPSKNPRSFTVYGRVAGAQDVPVGTFNDSVVATVNF